MDVQFQILRQHPDRQPWLQTYQLSVDPGQTVLDCLNQIKWDQDGTLTFRKNCRNTICGSCGLRINGRAALACKENIEKEVARAQATAVLDGREPNADIPTIAIAPMGNMPVIKDLVVDMKSFWNNLDAVTPYVSSAARQVPEREFLQSPAERDRLNQMGNCILCGSCYSDCNAREVNPDFVGPHALAKARRWVVDNRDTGTEARLEQYNDGLAGVWGCTRCYACNSVCPMDVAPMDQISHLKGEILDRHDDQASRPIRHRKVLVDLVKKGGWIDERKFGVRVVGNTFRDLPGLFSLGPLGLRMMTSGKFPLTFEPSTGQAEVRSLIEAVEAVTATSAPR
mgnify:CR=1 FL=1